MTTSLPYAGTSGYSGSEASRQRAEDRDSSGKTANVQATLARFVTAGGPRGHTIKEIRNCFPDDHHGTLSGALTALHKAGRVLRLTEQRDKCSVYVAPQFLLGREAVPPKRPVQAKEILLTSDMDAEFIGHLVIAALNSHDKVVVRFVADLRTSDG